MNPLGPVHAYVAPATVAVVRFIVLPVHTGLLLPGPGGAGLASVTVVLVVRGAQSGRLSSTITEYIPIVLTVIDCVVAPVFHKYV